MSAQSEAKLAETTLRIMRSGLEADPGASPRDRARIMEFLRKWGRPTEPASPSESVARIIRRKEAAQRLSCSLRTLDKLAAAGVLVKRKFPGRVRSSGFLEADVNALIQKQP